MKTNLLRMSIAAVLAAAAALAQSSIALDANVPFDFVAGGKALPAGHYLVDRGPATGTVIIKSVDGKGATFAMSNTAYSHNGRHDPRLVFHQYGNTYFLSEVWGPASEGSQLPESGQERQLAAGIAASSKTILASLR